MVDKLLLGCIGTESENLLIYIDLGKSMSIIHGLTVRGKSSNPQICFFFITKFYKIVITSGLVLKRGAPLLRISSGIPESQTASIGL